VTVGAAASPEYTQRKFGGGNTTSETYVVKPGQFAASNIADKSLNHTPFRRVAEALASELARRQYWPAKDAKDADLLIVVHWGSGGVRWPLGVSPMRTEATVPGNPSQLLMDQNTIPSNTPAAAGTGMPSTFPDYFVTLEAYDLHAPTAAERKRAIWTIDLSVPSPGRNFGTALRCMSAAAVDYVGRSTEERQHVRPEPQKTIIETGPVVILDEAK